MTDYVATNQMNHLNELIERECKNKTDFANRVGVSIVTVSRWANGRSRISRYSAEQINRAFPDYTVDYILGYSLEPHMDAERWEQSVDDSVAAFKGVQLKHIIDFSDHPYRVEWSDSLLHGDKPIVVLNKSTGDKLQITPEQWDSFVGEITDYIGFRLGQMFKWGC